MTCSNCGEAVPVGARFCPSCGQALLPRGDERRIVTVLFADLVGFTGLAEHRDPEQVKNLVDLCFQRLVADVAGFGGRVDKIVGDAIIALFGAPVAHEDDAERAVRCALVMQKTLRSLAEEIGTNVEMRIGVNTGEVLVGALRAGGDYTAMGDVMNTASRLQGAAAPGQVVVGASTHTATRSVVRYDAIGPLEAKGRQEPVLAWVACETTAPPGSRGGRSRVALVGREAELGLLEHTLEITVSRRRPNLVLLLGEAGVGKSRLAGELAAMAETEHGAMVLEGRCVPYGEANPYWPIAEAIRVACAVSDSDSVDAALRKCRYAVAEALDAGVDAPDVQRVAHGLLYIMGHQRPDLSFHNMDPSRARDEALHAVRQFVEGLARKGLVVIVMSELHWADDSLLAALDRLLDKTRNAPLLLVATARPELEGRWTPRPASYNLVTMQLDVLDTGAAESMMTMLLGAEPPRELRDFLLERSGGNPLFLEELVALLTEAGMLEREDGRLRFALPRDMPDVPPTLHGLVAARLDALPPGERSLLEDAAVVGRKGRVDAVASLAASRGADDVRGALDDLLARDLLVASDEEYEFKSDLVRDVAYETLTKAERARRHAAVAAWLAERAKEIDREDEYIEQLAHHYGVAAEFQRELGVSDGIPADVRDRALDALGRAARKAESRESYRLAAHLLDEALRLVAEDEGPARRGLLLARGRARARLRELKPAREDAELVREEAEESGDRHSVAGALTLLGEIEHLEGRGDLSAETLRRAAGMWGELGDGRGKADALYLLGMTEIFRGHVEAAEDTTREALRLFSDAGDRRGEAWGQQNLAWTAFLRGDLAAAEERLNVSAQTFTEIDDRGGVAWAVGFLAWVRFFQGRLEEAEDLVGPAVKETSDYGDPFAFGIMTVLQGHLRIWRGHLEEGIELELEALRAFREIGDAWGQLQALMPLSAALVAVGRVDEGLRRLEEGLQVSTLVADVRMRVFAANNAATIATMLGDAAGAERDLRQLLSAYPRDAPARAAFPEAVLGLALLQLGRPDDAKAHLDAAAAADEGARANLAGLQALCAAVDGRPRDAIGAADEVDAIRGGTYRDRVMARIARGLAFGQLGNAADAERAFADAIRIVDGTDNRLDQAVARLARARSLEALGSRAAASALAEAGTRLDEMHVAAVGWDTLFMLSASGVRGTAAAEA